MNDKIPEIFDKPELLEKMFNKVSSSNEINEQIDEKRDTIPNFLTDLTQECKNIQIVPTRTEEIKKIIEVLSRKNKANVVLIGESGVGKTSLVEQLAYKLSNFQVPDFLFDYSIYSLDFNMLMSNTGLRGMYEEKINTMKNFLYKRKSILFIDEIHSIYSHSKSIDFNNDILSTLKGDLAKGKIRIIGTTTVSELGESIQNDPALSRRIQTIYINETSDFETARIIVAAKKELENYHGAIITDEAIKFCLLSCKKFVNDKYFPDKAIEILDLTCSKVKLKRNSGIDKLEEIEKEKGDIYLTRYLEEIDKKKEREMEKTSLILSKKEDKIRGENLNENILLAEFLQRKENIYKIEEEMKELREEYKLEELSLKENIVLVKEKEKLREVEEKIKFINPKFKIEIKKEDIFETLEDLDIINKEVFSNHYIKNLQKLLTNQIPILEEQINKITNVIKEKINFHEKKMPKNKVLSFFFLIEDDETLGEELIDCLNKKFSKNKSPCFLTSKDVLISSNDPSFWKQKINYGHRIFIIDLDKRFINYSFLDLMKKIIKEGKYRNQYGTQCSFSSSIFLFRITNENYDNNKNVEATLNKYLDKELINSLDDVIIINQLTKIDKFKFFIQLMEKNNLKTNYLIDNSLKKFVTSIENNFKNIKEISFVCRELIKASKNTKEDIILCYDIKTKEILSKTS